VFDTDGRAGLSFAGALGRRRDLIAETSEPAGDLATALAHGARLLARAPHLAVEQAQEILSVMPGQREASLLLAQAHRASGDPAQAADVLRGLVAAKPADFVAWGDLADTLAAMGDAQAAADAYLNAVKASVTDPILVEAAVALREARLHVAEALLRARLLARPTDVAAIRMLAEVAARLGRYEDAGNLLSRALDLCPGFHQARRAQAQVLQRQERPAEALAEVERLLAVDPQDINSHPESVSVGPAGRVPARS
jgi:predicted Zn-dependent protease